MYSDLTTLKERLPEQTIIDLSDDENTGLVNEDAVNRSISDADTEIDSYLGTRYAVPVAPVPDLLQRLSLDLAIEILYGRKPYIETPEAVIRAAKIARGILADIAGGKVTIPAVAEDTTTTAGNAEFSANERIFSRTTMRGL